MRTFQTTYLTGVTFLSGPGLILGIIAVVAAAALSALAWRTDLLAVAAGAPLIPAGQAGASSTLNPVSVAASGYTMSPIGAPQSQR